MRAWQESRHPSAISVGRSSRWSAVSASVLPSTTRTLHFPHVPRPPHVESIGSPIQCAALNSVVPGGRRVVLSKGRYLTSSLRWIIRPLPIYLKRPARARQPPPPPPDSSRS